VKTCRSTEPTGTAALLVNSRGEYLLHLRDAQKPICDPGTWSLAGGPEPGESPDEAVAREIREETGLVIPGLTRFTTTLAHGPDLAEGRSRCTRAGGTATPTGSR
jgi:8-oxo-dGTP pyrophosphatase MutT (NUDIX family)